MALSTFVDPLTSLEDLTAQPAVAGCTRSQQAKVASSTHSSRLPLTEQFNVFDLSLNLRLFLRRLQQVKQPRLSRGFKSLRPLQFSSHEKPRNSADFRVLGRLESLAAGAAQRAAVTSGLHAGSGVAVEVAVAALGSTDAPSSAARPAESSRRSSRCGDERGRERHGRPLTGLELQPTRRPTR